MLNIASQEQIALFLKRIKWADELFKSVTVEGIPPSRCVTVASEYGLGIALVAFQDSPMRNQMIFCWNSVNLLVEKIAL